MNFLITLCLITVTTSFVSCNKTDKPQEAYHQNKTDEVADKPGKGIEHTDHDANQ